MPQQEASSRQETNAAASADSEAHGEEKATTQPTEQVRAGDAIDERIAALEADLDALRGRVDDVNRVDEAIERRADAALAAVDRVEDRLDRLESALERIDRAESGKPPETERPRSDVDPAARGQSGDSQGSLSRRCRGQDGQANTEFEWVDPNETTESTGPVRSETDVTSDSGRRQYSTGGAPTVADGPDASPDERGLVERLRDRL